MFDLSGILMLYTCLYFTCLLVVSREPLALVKEKNQKRGEDDNYNRHTQHINNRMVGDTHDIVLSLSMRFQQHPPVALIHF